MTSGRRPLPANVHLLHGNPSKLPKEKLEEATTAVPALHESMRCPSWIKGTARREWRWLAPRLVAYGFLSDIDRCLLETYCIAYAEWREAERHLETNPKVLVVRRGGTAAAPVQAPIRNPWLKIRDNALAHLTTALLQLGMGPSARTQLLMRPRDIPPSGNTTGTSARSGSDPLGILG